MIGGGLIATRDVDAVAAEITQTVLIWAGARYKAKVRVGHAIDWLLTRQLYRVDMLILDHIGAQYHRSLST